MAIRPSKAGRGADIRNALTFSNINLKVNDNMTQAFNPFAQPAQNPATYVPPAAPPVQAPAFTAPTQPAAPTPVAFGAPPPVQAQPAAGASGLDDPALDSGFSCPLFPHVDGIFGFQIVGCTGVPGKTNGGYTSEPAVGVTVRVLQSNHAGAPLNTDFVFRFKYDWQNNRPVPGDQGTVHAKMLKAFILATFGGSCPQGVFGALQQLFATHFDTDARYVKLAAELRDATWYDRKAKVQKTEPRRRDVWMSAQ